MRMRVVNVVDLMTLARPKDHPNGMYEIAFNELFTDNMDVVFAFHGYPGAIHQLVHGRPDADRFHCRGFIEEGTTTTPFDMVVRNQASRYHLVMDAINNAKRAAARGERPQGVVRGPAAPAHGIRRRAPGGHARGARLGPTGPGHGVDRRVQDCVGPECDRPRVTSLRRGEATLADWTHESCRPTHPLDPAPDAVTHAPVHLGGRAGE